MTAGQADGAAVTIDEVSGISPEEEIQEVTGMTIKEDNERIAEAVKGQATAKRRKPTPKELLQTTPPKIAKRGNPPAVLVPAMELLDEQDAQAAPLETPKPKSEKVTTVLEDPIENQSLIRMRAKWAAQRADVVVARYEAKEEAGILTPAEGKEMAQARKVAQAAWKLAEKELATLRSMREKAKKASPVAETAVAS